MSDDNVMKLIYMLGDDAKTAYITFLILDYGSLWIFFALITWGVRTVWKNRKNI